MLVELRAAAQVKGGGNARAWSSAEVYEDVMERLKSLRKDIDALTDSLLREVTEATEGADVIAGSFS